MLRQDVVEQPRRIAKMSGPHPATAHLGRCFAYAEASQTCLPARVEAGSDSMVKDRETESRSRVRPRALSR